MGLNLNGSSQYVTLGNGVNIANARPFTFVSLVDSASWRTSGAYGCVLSQGRIWYTSGSGGWTLEVEAATNPRFEVGWNHTGPSARSFTTTHTGTPNTGLYLIGGSLFDAGSDTNVRIFSYRYGTAAFNVESNDPTGTTDSNIGNSAAGDPFLIGAGWTNSSTTEDYYPGHILWTAAFDGDLIGSGTTLATCPWISALIFQGPWGLMDRCRWLHSYQQGHANDISGAATRRNGTLTGSPSYGYTKALMATGLPPDGPVLATRAQAAAAQDTPELYGRPFGLHGAQQMAQLLAQ